MQQLIALEGSPHWPRGSDERGLVSRLPLLHCLDGTDAHGRTALWLAAAHGHDEVRHRPQRVCWVALCMRWVGESSLLLSCTCRRCARASVFNDALCLPFASHLLATAPQ
jgi:hypothetical protein